MKDDARTASTEKVSIRSVVVLYMESTTQQTPCPAQSYATTSTMQASKTHDIPNTSEGHSQTKYTLTDYAAANPWSGARGTHGPS